MEKFLYVFLISMLPIVELRAAIPVGAALGLDAVSNAAAAILGNLLPVPFILLFIPKILDLLERIPFLAPVVRWVRRKADKHSGKILGTQPQEPTEQSAAPTDTPTADITPDGITAEEAVTACTDGAVEVAPPTEDPAPTGDALSASGGIPTDGAAGKKRRKGGAAALFWALMIFVMIPLPGTGAWTGSLVAALFNLPKKLSFPAVTLGVLGSAVIMSLASYGVLEFLSFLL